MTDKTKNEIVEDIFIDEDNVVIGASVNDIEEEEYENLPIPMNMSGLLDEEGYPITKYSVDDFRKGTKVASFYAGFVTAMLNSGVTENGALAVLDMHINREMFPKQVEAQKDLAKIQSIKSSETEF